MRFTLIVAFAACQSIALRPELGRVGISKHIARVGEIVSKISSPSNSLVALKDATSIVNGVLAQTGNATDHMSGDDAELLKSVVSLVEKTIYSSMDASHVADVAELKEAIRAASQCNADVANRQSPEGDLGILHQAVRDKQTELDRLQGVVDDKTEINNTKYNDLVSHMEMIAEPPACPGLPARTMPALDVFFEKSEYSVWFSAQQGKYGAVRDDFVAADSALKEAVQAYNIQKAIRDVQYCDWKSELEAACAAFDVCFSETSDFYTNILVPRVTKDMKDRIEVKKAGDTLVHQIKFLLGEVAEQQTPDVDTSRYEIVFPDLPPKGLCDLSPLDADEWAPPVSCSKEPVWRLVARQTFPGFFKPGQWSRNADDDSSDNFAILDKLEDFRDKDGGFEFKLSWPRGDSQDQIWRQTSNPVTHGKGTKGYEAVSVVSTNQFWKGLETNTNGRSLLDGSVNHGHWFYAVGSFKAWRGGIPAYHNTIAQQQVELYVKTDKP